MKKLVSLALAAVLAVSAVGCGSSDSSSSTADSAQSTEAAADGATFKIGGIGPITGGAAIYGQAVMNAAQMAVDKINADGGINGYQVEFHIQDDEADSEKSVNAYNTLKDWGMQALLGTVTSTPCVAVGEVAQADNMFLLTPSGTAVDCVKYDNAFRVCFSDPMQGLESSKYIGENGLAKKVAVIYDSSDVYSTGIYEAFVKESKNQDFEVVSVEQFTSESKKDFSVQIQKAKDAGAELVFLPFYYTEATLVLKQAADMNYKPIFFGCDGMDGILDVDGFDAALAEGLMFLSPFTPTSEDPAIQEFVTKFKDEFGVTFNKYLIDKRLHLAMKLLKETTYTNRKIAHLCGFNSENYFMTVFKKNIGITPKEYKQSLSN